MLAHEKTRLVACRTSAAQYLNGRNTAVHHYLLPVNSAADGGAPGFHDGPTAICVPSPAPTASSVSLGVVGM